LTAQTINKEERFDRWEQGNLTPNLIVAIASGVRPAAVMAGIAAVIGPAAARFGGTIFAVDTKTFHGWTPGKEKLKE
jgi:hypothetical protein